MSRVPPRGTAERQQHTIAKQMRSLARANKHVLDLLDKNENLKYEVGRLERKLVAIYRHDDPVVMREIARSAVPRKIGEWEARHGANEDQEER